MANLSGLANLFFLVPTRVRGRVLQFIPSVQFILSASILQLYLIHGSVSHNVGGAGHRGTGRS